jgi:hypothetical protein
VEDDGLAGVAGEGVVRGVSALCINAIRPDVWADSLQNALEQLHFCVV